MVIVFVYMYLYNEMLSLVIWIWMSRQAWDTLGEAMRGNEQDEE